MRFKENNKTEKKINRGRKHEKKKNNIFSGSLRIIKEFRIKNIFLMKM